MPDDLERQAAAHSQEAFALLKGARSLRRAALDIRVASFRSSRVEESDIAGFVEDARRLAERVDAFRRKIMAASENPQAESSPVTSGIHDEH